MGVTQKTKTLAQQLHEATPLWHSQEWTPALQHSQPELQGQELCVWGDTPYFVNTSLSAAPFWNYLLVH